VIFAAARARLLEIVVALIGMGRIGHAIARSLSTDGVGCLVQVDPQRIDREAEEAVFDYGGWGGEFKVHAMADRIMQQRPTQLMRPVPSTFEDARDAGLLGDVDVFVSCANRAETRRAVVAHARQLGALVVSAAVSIDGSAGEIVRWHPAVELACPACLLPPPGAVLPRDSGLPTHTTGLAASLAVAVLADTLERGLSTIQMANVFQFDEALSVDSLRVHRRLDCVAGHDLIKLCR